jgi:hypothetical protein
MSVRIACAVTGLPESFFRRHALIRKTWRDGREYRIAPQGMEINIEAYERWVEHGDSAQEQPTPSTPPPKRRRPPASGITRLYRHFDAAGQLLYVGISLGVMHRLQQHLASSSWAAAIARVDVQTFCTRAEALHAERLAIESERPLHNVVHANQRWKDGRQ